MTVPVPMRMPMIPMRMPMIPVRMPVPIVRMTVLAVRRSQTRIHRHSRLTQQRFNLRISPVRRHFQKLRMVVYARQFAVSNSLTLFLQRLKTRSQLHPNRSNSSQLKSHPAVSIQSAVCHDSASPPKSKDSDTSNVPARDRTKLDFPQYPK